MMNNQTLYSMTYWVQSHRAVTPFNTRSFDAMVRNTGDFLAAGVAAPVGSLRQHRKDPLAGRVARC